MKSFLTRADYIIWISTLVLEFLIVAAGMYRKHYRRHPAFLAYIGFSALKTMTLMYIAQTGDVGSYTVAYWSGMIVKTGFMVAVVLEIVTDIFKFYTSIPEPTARRVLLLVLLMLVVIISAASFFPAGHHNQVDRFFNTLDRTANFIVLGLVWLVIVQSDLLGIPKTVTMYGICAGLLFVFSVDAVVSAATWLYSAKQQMFLRPISMGTFAIAEMIWLRYMMRPLPELQPLSKEKARWVLQIMAEIQSTSNINKIS